MLLIIIWYFFHNYLWPRPWPQPPEIDLDLGLVSLVSASGFWPRLTSLLTSEPKDYIRQIVYIDIGNIADTIDQMSPHVYYYSFMGEYTT